MFDIFQQHGFTFNPIALISYLISLLIFLAGYLKTKDKRYLFVLLFGLIGLPILILSFSLSIFLTDIIVAKFSNISESTKTLAIAFIRFTFGGFILVNLFTFIIEFFKNSSIKEFAIDFLKTNLKLLFFLAFFGIIIYVFLTSAMQGIK